MKIIPPVGGCFYLFFFSGCGILPVGYGRVPVYAIAGMIILNPDSDLRVIVPDMRAPDRELFLHCQNIFLGLVYLAFLAILIRYPELPLGPYVQTGLCFV